MANDDERLVVLLEARIRDYEKNLAQASGTTGREFGKMRRSGKSAMDAMEQDVQRSTSRINQALATSTAKIGAYGKAFAGGLVGGIAAGGIAGIISTLSEVAKGMAAIGDEAKKAGIGVKAFQELKYVAEQNRVGVDSLVDGIKELNLRADEFIVTGKGSAAEAFQRLGYNATTLTQKLKDPSALFTEIIGKLKQLDKAAQIRIADEVFGGTGGEQFVQLIDLGEQGIRDQIKAANDLGIVMDEKLIAKAAELDRKFNQVATTVGSALKRAVVEAAGALESFITEFRRFDADFQQRRSAVELGGLMGSMAGGMTPAQREAINGFERTRADIVRDIERTEQGIANARDNQAPEEEIKAAEQQLSALRQQLETVQQQIRAQRELNLQKQQTVHLDQVVVQADPQPSTGGRSRYYSSSVTQALPDTVSVTPSDGGGQHSYFGGPAEAKKAGAEAGESMAVAYIKKFESFKARAYNDPRLDENGKQRGANVYRAGWGSDTTTREGGHVERITAASVVSLADANRDLARRIGEFQKGIRGDIGSDLFESFSKEQQAALTSIAYNYGSLPDRIVKAIQNGSREDVAVAIGGLSGDNGGVNKKRRLEEADLFASGTSSVFEGYNRLSSGAESVQEANRQLQQSYRELGEIGIGAMRGIADAMADGKLEGRELISILFDVVEQLMAMPAMPGAPGGGGMGFLGSLLGMGAPAFQSTPNGFANMLGLPKFAKGTDFAPGGRALVGEEGPEIVQLPRGSQVVPNGKTREALAGGGHSTTFAPVTNITVGANAGVTKGDVEEIVQRNNKELQKQQERARQNSWRYE